MEEDNRWHFKLEFSFPKPKRLIAFLKKHGHWFIFPYFLVVGALFTLDNPFGYIIGVTYSFMALFLWWCLKPKKN